MEAIYIYPTNEIQMLTDEACMIAYEYIFLDNIYNWPIRISQTTK